MVSNAYDGPSVILPPGFLTLACGLDVVNSLGLHFPLFVNPNVLLRLYMPDPSLYVGNGRQKTCLINIMVLQGERTVLQKLYLKNYT